MEEVKLREVREIIALVKELLEGYDQYFSHDELNSEGKKLMKRIIVLALKVRPQLLPSVKRLRRRPSLNSVIRFLRLLGETLGDLEVMRMIEELSSWEYGHLSPPARTLHRPYHISDKTWF